MMESRNSVGGLVRDEPGDRAGCVVVSLAGDRSVCANFLAFELRTVAAFHRLAQRLFSSFDFRRRAC
jgi:hypothetical protein